MKKQKGSETQKLVPYLAPLLARLGLYGGSESFIKDWIASVVLSEEQYFELGEALIRANAYETLRIVFADWVRRAPNHALAHHNLGFVLHKMGHFEAAGAELEQAFKLAPGAATAPDSLYAYAVAMRSAGKFDAAESALRRLLDVRRINAEVRTTLAYTLFSMGRYAESWPYFESRYDRPNKPSWAIMDETQWPMWRGESLAGKRLLVVGEQGVGDQTQFASWLPLVAVQAARTEIMVSPGLKDLFSSLSCLADVHEVTPTHLQFDYWVYLLSIPLRLGLSTADALTPGSAAFVPNSELVERYRPLLTLRADDKRLKVGIVWAGNPSHSNDRFRSMPLDTLAPILELNACWISLQRDIPPRDRNSPWLGKMQNLGPTFKSMDETAAVIAQLDLVISIDSAPAHLAASLGIPTWVLVPQNVDWRWPRNEERTFWYPTMRLFQQQRQGDWSVPIASARRGLAQMIDSPITSVCE